MRDKIVILSFDRPELLALCLERLTAAPGICKKEIWVCQDRKMYPDLDPSPQILREIQDVAQRFDAQYIENEYRTPKNNGMHTVLSLRRAYAAGANRIYLVEDDVLVSPDFFSFTDGALHQFSEMPVVCCRGITRGLISSKFSGDPLAVCITEGSGFKQLATAFEKKNLEDILRGIRPEYCEQFDRELEGTIFVAPFVARAFDIGRYSSIPGEANEQEARPTGTLEEKIAKIRCRHSIEPVASTNADAPEMNFTLALDTRLRQSQPGFVLMRQRQGGQLSEYWIAEEYAENSIRSGAWQVGL